MSRVADALRLAKLDRPAADAFTARDHPWHWDLEVDDNREVEWGTESHHRSPYPDTDDDPASAAEPRPTETDVSSAISPLAGLDPAIRQQIAGVVERVFLPTSGDIPRMVAFAAIDADGRSGWVAACVAEMLARRAAAKVAVVDMNFANPRLHECFGVSQTPGLIEALGTDTPLLQLARQVRPNLWAIPAGAASGITELTAGSRARISRLATAYDHVIVSLEPLAAWCGGGLPTMADGIVLVIAADTTRREAGRKIAERLQASGAAILGAVLTNRRYAIPEAIYKRL